MTIAVVLLPFGNRAAASQSVTVQGNPTPLTVVPLTNGQPGTATSNRTTYTITVATKSVKKITAQLGTAMPTGTTLSGLMEVPAGSSGVTSYGSVLLGTTPVDLVTGFSQVSGLQGGIIYKFTANVTAGVIAATTRTVTFTVTNGP